MEKRKKLSFSEKLSFPRAHWKLLGFFVAIIVVSSFFASMVATNFGKINIKDISFDAEGAILSATLYSPPKALARAINFPPSS